MTLLLFRFVYIGRARQGYVLVIYTEKVIIDEPIKRKWKHSAIRNCWNNIYFGSEFECLSALLFLSICRQRRRQQKGDYPGDMCIIFHCNRFLYNMWGESGGYDNGNERFGEKGSQLRISWRCRDAVGGRAYILWKSMRINLNECMGSLLFYGRWMEARLAGCLFCYTSTTTIMRMSWDSERVARRQRVRETEKMGYNYIYGVGIFCRFMVIILTGQ